MWLSCYSHNDEFTQQWKEKTENLIVQVKRVKRLGKRCIVDRELSRRDPHDDDAIVQCFRNIDQELLSMKLSAVHFLSPNLTLLKQRNEKIELYKQQAGKQLQVIELKREVVKLKQELTLVKLKNQEVQDPEETDGDLENQESHEMQAKQLEEDEELIQSVSECQFTKIFWKQNKVIGDLKGLLSNCDRELQFLKSHTDNLQTEVQDKLDTDSSDQEEPVQTDMGDQENESDQNDLDYTRRTKPNRELSYDEFEGELLQQSLSVAQGCFEWIWNIFLGKSNEEQDNNYNTRIMKAGTKKPTKKQTKLKSGKKEKLKLAKPPKSRKKSKRIEETDPEISKRDQKSSKINKTPKLNESKERQKKPEQVKKAKKSEKLKETEKPKKLKKQIKPKKVSKPEKSDKSGKYKKPKKAKKI